MPNQSSLNLREFARKLGLQDLSSARIDPNPQTVLVASDLRALLPQMRPPTAVFGGQALAVAAQFSQVFIQSVDPGGLIIRHLDAGAIAGVLWGILPIGTAIPGTAVVQPNAGVFNEVPDALPPMSRVLENAQVANFFTTALNPVLNPFFGRDNIDPPLVLAPGRVLCVESIIVNNTVSYTTILQGVPVSTGVV